MPTALTDGFSLAALVPESLLSQVFSRTFLQTLPGLTVDVGQGRQVTLWFHGASLSLAPRPLSFVNPVVVEIGFTARLTSEYNQVTGTIRLRTNVTQIRVESGAESFVAPVLDLRTNALDGFEVSGLTPQEKPVWEPPITAAIKPRLAAVSPLTAGPLLPDRGVEYFLTTDPSTPYGAGDGVLAVHVWSEPGPPPNLPLTLAPRNVRANRAIALVPRDRVDQAIDASRETHGLKNLPTQVDDVTLSALSIQWHEFGVGQGHFYITGTVDHWSGDVNFEAWLQLIAVDGKVKVNVLRTRQNIGVFADVLDLFSGGAITRALEEILPRAVSGIGGGAFGELDIFATGVVPQAQAFATMSINGPIDVWPDGLGVPAQYVARDVTSSFPPLQYLLGHRGTREFHTEGCKYGVLVKNPSRFPTWERAIQLGYNGCWYCQSDFNVVATGHLTVVVAGDKMPIPVVTARLVSRVERFGVVVTPPVEELSGRFGWDSQAQVRRYPCEVLVPGSWEVTVSLEQWTVTTVAEVGPAWQSGGTAHGTITVVRVTVGLADIVVERTPR